jgi:uncharacterized protein (TIGR02217 family)
MTIPVLGAVVLPNSVIEAGVRGRQIRRNTRVATVNGAESINVVWSQTLREFELGIAPMRREAWQQIETLHEITDGGAQGFLMEDPKDAQVNNGVLVSLGGNKYQIYKRYTEAASGLTKDRKITRPRSVGFVFRNAGGLIPTSAYALDTTKGIVTLLQTVSLDALQWSGRFYVPVHFQSDSIDWTLVVSGVDPDSRFLAGPSVLLQEVRE